MVENVFVLIKSELKEHVEEDLAYSKIHLALTEIAKCVHLEDKERTFIAYAKMDQLLEHHKVNKPLMVSYLLIYHYSLEMLDPQIIHKNIGKITLFFREFDQMLSITNFERNYHDMNVISMLMKFKESIGYPVNTPIAINYFELWKSDKLSYIGLLSVLESRSDPNLEPYFDIALV